MVSYKCYLCNYDTINKSDYSKHCLTSKHIKNEDIEKRKNETIDKINQVKKIKDGLKLSCKYCNNKYSTNSNLNRHLRSCKKYVKHQKKLESEKTFCCYYCKQKCNDKTHYVFHERKCMRKRIEFLEEQLELSNKKNIDNDDKIYNLEAKLNIFSRNMKVASKLVCQKIDNLTN